MNKYISYILAMIAIYALGSLLSVLTNKDVFICDILIMGGVLLYSDFMKRK